MATYFCSFLGHPMATAFGGQRLATDFSMQNDRNTAEMPPRNHRDPSETQPKYLRDRDTNRGIISSHHQDTKTLPRCHRNTTQTHRGTTKATEMPPRH
jgi:hypothetical protein